MDATTTMSVPNQWRYASFVYEASFSSVTGPYQILRVPSGSDPDNYKVAVSGRWLVVSPPAQRVACYRNLIGFTLLMGPLNR